MADSFKNCNSKLTPKRVPVRVSKINLKENLCSGGKNFDSDAIKTKTVLRLGYLFPDCFYPRI